MRFSPTLLLSQSPLTRRATTSSSSPRLYNTVSALNPTLSNPQIQHHSNHLKVGDFEFNLSNPSEIRVQRLLNSSRDNPSLAFSFLEQLRSNGVSLSVNAYATVVRILCSWGLDRKLDSVLLELISNEERGFDVMDLIVEVAEEEEESGKGSLLVTRVSSSLVKAYVSLGMFDEAIDVLVLCNRLGYVPSIKTCNFLMNRLVDCGKIDTVVALFLQLKQLGLCANEYTNVIMVKALCRKGDLGEAAKLVEETTSVFVYTTFIEGLCLNGKTNLALGLIKDLIDREVLCGDDLGIVYGMVVRGFCNEMNVEAAEEVIFEMEKSGFGPDVYACSTIIDRHCKDVNLPKALGFLDVMVEKGLKVNCVIVSSILQCYCKMGLFEEALQKFYEFRERNIFLDRVCYNVAFDALGKLDRVEDAIGLFNEMRDSGMDPDVINYTTLVGGYCREGKFVDALELVDEMRLNGFSPDAITYGVLAGGLARNGHAKEALAIYDRMKDEGLEPDAVTHNEIIEGLCFARQTEKAEEFIRSLESKCLENYASLVKGYCESGLSEKAFTLFRGLDFPLSKNVYYKLFTSLCIEGRLNKALAVLNRMGVVGVEPKRSMYRKMIKAWCRLNNVREAQLLFDRMIGRGLVPDVLTYTIMIHTYCRLEELHKAEDLFVDMKQRGIKPDVVTYTVLLHSYLKLDKERDGTGFVQGGTVKRKASELWMELQDSGIEPDVKCYTVLINRQCKIRKVEYAEVLFEQMIEKGLEPDKMAYKVLTSGYRRNGYTDKADILVTELSRNDISPTEYLWNVVKRAIRS